MKPTNIEYWVALALVVSPSLASANIYSPVTSRQSKSIPSAKPRDLFCFNRDYPIKGSRKLKVELIRSSQVGFKRDTIFDAIRSIRAGSMEETDDTTDNSDDASDDDDEEEEDENYYDEYDEYDEDEQDMENAEAEEEQSAENGRVEIVYDEPLQPTISLQLGTSVGVMILCRRFDLYEPKVVRFARFLFVAYMVAMQVFMAYIRIKAHLINDRTSITLSNPLTSLVQSRLERKGGGGGDMVKEMASQVLSSESTVMEYDLKQIKSLNGSLLFNLVFMWVLHFRMNQIQPLFLQTASGLTNLFFNPLFQVYVLGRNLERPFKNPRFGALQEKMEADIKAMGDAGGEDAAAKKELAETEEDESSDVEGEDETETDQDDDSDVDGDDDEEESSDVDEDDEE